MEIKALTLTVILCCVLDRTDALISHRLFLLKLDDRSSRILTGSLAAADDQQEAPSAKRTIFLERKSKHLDFSQTALASQFVNTIMADNPLWDDYFGWGIFLTAVTTTTIVTIALNAILFTLKAVCANTIGDNIHPILRYLIITLIEISFFLYLIRQVVLSLFWLYQRDPTWLPWLLKTDRYGYHWYPEVEDWISERGFHFNQAPIVLEEKEADSTGRTVHISDTKILARLLWQDMRRGDM